MAQVPQSRLTWPALLEHPFVRETSEDIEARVSDLSLITNYHDYCKDGTKYMVIARRFALQLLLLGDMMHLGREKEISRKLNCPSLVTIVSY